MSAITNDKTITLKSSDGKTFAVAEVVAIQSVTIKNVLKDIADENMVIPLPEVNCKTLTKVVSYCKKHVKELNEEDEKVVVDLRKWDEMFVAADQAILYDLLMAANYLNIPSLLELITTKVVNMLQKKKPEQIRKKFKIQIDFTNEEEERIRKGMHGHLNDSLLL